MSNIYFAKEHEDYILLGWWEWRDVVVNKLRYLRHHAPAWKRDLYHRKQHVPSTFTNYCGMFLLRWPDKHLQQFSTEHYPHQGTNEWGAGYDPAANSKDLSFVSTLQELSQSEASCYFPFHRATSPAQTLQISAQEHAEGTFQGGNHRVNLSPCSVLVTADKLRSQEGRGWNNPRARPLNFCTSICYIYAEAQYNWTHTTYTWKHISLGFLLKSKCMRILFQAAHRFKLYFGKAISLGQVFHWSKTIFLF